MAAAPTPRRASTRRATTSTPPRAALLVAEALFADKTIKRKKATLDDPDGEPASPQRGNSKVQRKSIDLGKPLGPFDNNSVRDRVRKWQSQGGGVIEQRDPTIYPPEVTPVASDVGTDQELDSGGEPFKFEGPMKTRTRKDARLKAKAEAAAAAGTKQNEEETMERAALRGTRHDSPGPAKASASPKKRVISDSNWRRRQAGGGDGSSAMGQKKYGPSSPSPSTSPQPDDGIRVTPMREISAARRRRRDIDEKRLGSGRLSNEESPAMRKMPSKPKVDSDGIRVYSTPLLTPDTPSPSRSKRLARSVSESDRKGKPLDRTPPSVHSARSKRTVSSESQQSTLKQWSPTSAAALNAKKHAEQSSRQRKRSQSKEKPSDVSAKLISPRGGGATKVNILREVFDEGKKIFAKTPEPAPLHRSGQRIESWLNETADPFLDNPLAPVIEPLASELGDPDHSTQEAPPSTQDDLVENGHGQSAASRSRESATSLDRVQISKEDEDSIVTPPSLRRTGAKRGSPSASPSVRSRFRKSVPSPDENGDVLSDMPSRHRPFPSTGHHRLSTIASVETFSVAQSAAPSIIPEPHANSHDINDDCSTVPGKKTSLKRRLTTHADLISVLSLPHAGNQSIVSARSIRTNRSRLSKATVADIMKELSSDEAKYMRELRTLVDGVIPVLLTCVLSKSDSAVAAGLFSQSASASEDSAITRPIVDMGIALERLKVLHKRIPLHDPERLLTWAQGAHKTYQEYLQAWRMGFQDVVVNLAPAAETQDLDGEDHSVLNGLPRNAQGDVTNGDGERVDVAFLLKRPLVRLKYLAKSFKGLNHIKPSFSAGDMASKYENLINEAKNRSNEERARLEDEAAAMIDSTRVRDHRTLAPIAEVVIQRTRRVRARDFFSLEMQHSSGQLLDCRVELLLRDEVSGNGGDLLICELDGTGRWLLFPPADHGHLSARNGDRRGEIILMIRNYDENGQEWRETLSLITDSEEAGFEWVQMIGLTPIPPMIQRTKSFIERQPCPQTALVSATAPLVSSAAEIEIPIGEPVRKSSKTGGIQLCLEPLVPQNADSATSDQALLPTKLRDSKESTRPARDLNDAMEQAGSPTTPRLRRQRARKYSRTADGSPNTPKPSRLSLYLEENAQSSPIVSPEQTPTSSQARTPGGREHSAPRSSPVGQSPSLISDLQSKRHQRTASAPALNLPIIPKLRSTEQDSGDDNRLAPEEALATSTSPKKPTPKRYRKDHQDRSTTSSPTPFTEDLPPIPPVHRSNPKTSSSPKSSVVNFGPSTFSPGHRRSSSPLKHEYEPSSASDSSLSDVLSEADCDTLSDATSDEELEDGDAPTPLLPLGPMRKFGKASPQGSIYSLPNGTLGPSQSASQAPFRTVPPQPQKASRTVAAIFSWSDKGAWESLHPGDCSIVVTPGLIEAFQMSADHSRPLTSDSSKSGRSSESGQRPLVALELTPLVPLRRGTALDISIRSPPTPQSTITSGNNIMFRSRSAEECETLYSFINQSRINNPTYIALQNARAHTETLNRLERQTSARHSRSRWGWASRSSYRATSSGRGPGSTAVSESSVGSLASAFSALRRFGAPGATGSKMFNISKSTVSSRIGGMGVGGSGSNSLYSSSSGSSTPMPPLPEGLKHASPGIGLSNAKIRLYHREGANRWRDMGSARLTITLALPAGTGNPSAPVGAGSGEVQKRILVIGKSKGECLLDVCLGESCFERIARTGIAISIWEEVFGPNGEVGQVPKEGGVGPGKRGVYMVQMKSEAETAYTFSLVGKLRY